MQDDAATGVLTPAVRSGRTRRTRTWTTAVDAAAELFAAQGYGEVSVADIAAASRLGQATIYGVFGSKSVLVAAAFEAVVLDGWVESPVVVDTRSSVGKVLSALVSRASAHRGLTSAYRHAHAETGGGTPEPSRLSEIRSVMVEPVHQRLVAAVRVGAVAPVAQRLLTADLLVDAILRVSTEVPLDHVGAVAKEYLEAIPTFTGASHG